MGPVALAQDGPVYLDAQVLIYAVEGREPFAEQLMPLWQAVDRGELAGVTSELTWLEVLVHPLRHHDREREEQFRQALRHPHLVVRPITLEALLEAARLRALHPALRTPDAIHLATALGSGCATLLSNDQRLPRVPGLAVVSLAGQHS